LLGLSLAILALAQPQGKQIPTKAQKIERDLVILLDVSRSMLSEDLKPSRLERTKEMLMDLADSLSGERVALILFSGRVKIKTPLTQDYYFLKQVIKEADPSEIYRGGSKIGDAIRAALTILFFEENLKNRDIILITDGEDQETEPLKAAQLAAAKGVRIHTIGIGSLEGAEIPTSNGKISKLNDADLKEIAKITNAVYIPAEDKQVDLGKLYQDYIQNNNELGNADKDSIVREELFFWFLAPAMILLSLEPVLVLSFYRKLQISKKN
ncbi:MAG: VWA domain-containing protein, partial [SAR324 cluster bacterium]|nr:VWA domain-containing protein [SAR324 cluster bacterium]